MKFVRSSIYTISIVASPFVFSQESKPDSSEEKPPPPPARLRIDPARDLFEAAQLTFQEAREATNKKAQQTAYESAVRTFNRFLSAFPNDSRRYEVQFYLANCYQQLGNTAESEKLYQALANATEPNPFSGVALQQSADTAYSHKDFKTAAGLFQKIAQTAIDPEQRQLALFRKALCWQEIQRSPNPPAKADETLKEALRAVVFDEGSPYQEQARAAISSLYAQTGETERALANYELLITSQDKERAEQALLQCALLSHKLKQTTKAHRYFAQILASSAHRKWHGQAQLTLMTAAYQKKNYTKLVELYQATSAKVSAEHESQRLAMAAEAYRQLGDSTNADRLYARLSRVSKDSGQAFDAGYAVVTSQYREKDRKFPREAQAFLRNFSSDHPEDPRIDNVWLMLAERLNSQEQFSKAAQAYSKIRLEKIPAGSQARVRYRLGYSQLKSGKKNEAIRSLSSYLENHPKDSNTTRALLHRANLYQEEEDYRNALTDYNKILKSKPDEELSLTVLSKLADIYRKHEDFSSLISIHNRLLKNYPQRSEADQAASHFILGWSHFKQNNYESALPEFEKARALNPQKLGQDATIHLALIHFARQDEGSLRPELRRLQEDYAGAKLPPQIYAWLGTRLATAGNHEEAWTYLKEAVDFSKSGKTKTPIWKAYSLTAVALGKYREAQQSCDILIPREESPYLRAVLLQRRAEASLGLRDYAAAANDAKAALELKPQGQLNAELRITMGDISMKQQKIDEALGHYVVVAELIGSAETQTEALQKAITCYQEKGDSTSLAEAAKYKKRLAQKP